MRAAIVTTMLAVAVLVAPVARAQIVRDMTPAQVQQAIDFGTKAKDLSAYGIQEKAKFSWPPVIGAYTTPFLRVALAAHEAKKKFDASLGVGYAIGARSHSTEILMGLAIGYTWRHP